MNITSGVPIPTKYKPQCAADFFGPARNIAEQIVASAKACVAKGEPSAFLFYGDPGTSKSRLADFTLAQFGVTDFQLTKKSGVDMTVDFVRGMAQEFQYTNMGGYKGWWFEEIDEMPMVAQVRYLMTSDEQPSNTVIVATCNSGIDALEPRFHRRFQCLEVLGPKAGEIVGLFSKWLPEADAKRFAELASINPNTGKPDPNRRINVGAAMSDLKTLVERRSMA